MGNMVNEDFPDTAESAGTCDCSARRDLIMLSICPTRKSCAPPRKVGLRVLRSFLVRSCL